jgi:phage tail-like protein
MKLPNLVDNQKAGGSSTSNLRAVSNTTATDKYLGTFRFRVQVQTISSAQINQAWTRVSGVVSESEPMEFMHGVDPFVRKAPGRSTFGDVTMERVYEGIDSLYRWRRAIESGWDPQKGDFRRDITVEMLDRAMNPVRKIILRGAWPLRWEMPELDASNTSPAMEKITFCVEEVYEDAIDSSNNNFAG